MKTRTLGMYVLPGPSAMDWDRACADMAEAGYTHVSLFAAHAISGRWPIALDPMLRAMGENSLSPHWCFMDQFLDPADNAIIAKIPDEEARYSSLTLPPPVFHWLSWREEPGGVIVDYRLNDAGRWLQQKLISPIIRKTAQWCDKFPLMRPSYKWGNETLAMSYPDGHTVNKRGDRDEVQRWVRQQWADAGVSAVQYYDYTCVRYGKKKTDLDYLDYDKIGVAYRAIRRRGARLEVHGIMTLADCERLQVLAGVSKQFCKFSTDGDMKMLADYRELGRSALLDVDLKWDCKPSEARRWMASTNMERWAWKWPLYKTYV